MRNQILENVTVTIESDILPTEDKSKVERAVRNIFPLIEIRLEENKVRRIKYHAEGLKILSEFRSLLKRNKIRAAARSIMLRSISASSITVNLNKQAAYAGHVSFTTDPNESPLGPIILTIKSPTPQEVIDWLVKPKTQEY
ncbi:RNA-binding domain-containing protein [[Eubacterium] cellulosolvens]